MKLSYYYISYSKMSKVSHTAFAVHHKIHQGDEHLNWLSPYKQIKGRFLAVHLSVLHNSEVAQQKIVV